jgi:hypothetical protein
MNITILNGALPGDKFTDKLQVKLIEQLLVHHHRVLVWTLREEKIAFCLGCFECWTKYPGLCRIDDTGQAVTESIIQSDLAIYLTPVTFGGYSSELKKALDRSIGLILPFFTRIKGEVHHQPRYKHYPRLLGIGVLPAPNPNQEQLFATLITRNAINMHAPENASVFVYRTQEEERILDVLDRVLGKVDLIQPQLSLERKS